MKKRRKITSFFWDFEFFGEIGIWITAASS